MCGFCLSTRFLFIKTTCFGDFINEWKRELKVDCHYSKPQRFGWMCDNVVLMILFSPYLPIKLSLAWGQKINGCRKREREGKFLCWSGLIHLCCIWYRIFIYMAKMRKCVWDSSIKLWIYESSWQANDDGSRLVVSRFLWPVVFSLFTR